MKKARTRRIPACPECGGKEIIPMLHGVITAAQQRAIDAGKAIHADREEWEGLSEWFCKTCRCDWSRHSRRFKKAGHSVNATGA